MALAGKIAYLAEPLNYFRSHRGNVRSSTQAGALGVAEYFYVMLSILGRVAPRETLVQKNSLHWICDRPLSELSPLERIKTARKLLACVADWNLRHNLRVPRKAMREYFRDWDFALVGKEFAISPPSRWQFFLHRCRFYRDYFIGMGWKMRLINLLRLVGAPVVGYKYRHWPEETLARFLRVVDMS